MPPSEWLKRRSGQRMTWQKGVKEITRSLDVVGVVRLPRWGPRDPTCACLETLHKMAANRCQWLSCFLQACDTPYYQPSHVNSIQKQLKRRGSASVVLLTLAFWRDGRLPSSAVKKALSEYQKAHKRAERERLRLMKEHQHELERKKKLEEKERKMLEKQAKKDEEERLKEERRLKRLEELKKKEEEKEAERKRKEEEKRKKEEERIQKELERRREEDFKTKREEKQRAVLLGFLVKGEQKKETSTPLSAPCGPFMQFELRKDMRMAPLHRVPKSLLTTKRDNLDKVVQSWSHESSSVPGSSLGLLKFGRSSYIHELKTKQHVPLSCPSTWPTWNKLLVREFTDWKVRGSNPNSASRLPLLLGQPGSIQTLVPPSCGMAARHRKGATAERFLFFILLESCHIVRPMYSTKQQQEEMYCQEGQVSKYFPKCPKLTEIPKNPLNADQKALERGQMPPEVMLMGEGPCSTLNSPTLKYHGSRGSGGTVWLRAKLFQFVENYRPAYYGSWRRRSRIVTGRRPFAQDVRQLDYSVDSDDEWEEDEPGESITQSEPPEVMLMGEGPCSTLNSPTLKYHGSRGSGGTVWLRAKLFQFVENYRPAYYGSWRRRSRIVTGRRPFAQDVRQLDYSVDSDDEWEEDEPGESITQSENEEEEEEKDEEEEEEEDDTFFVPHGYLSDDEGVAAEDVGEEDAAAEEMKNLRRRLSVVEYETAHRRGLQRLIPLVLGPVWLPNPVESIPAGNVLSSNDQLDEDKENIETIGVRVTDSTSVDKSSLQLVRSALSIYRVHLWDSAVPITVQMDIPATQSTRRTRRELPEEAVPYLIQLVHKSPLGKLKLAFEFRVFWHKHTTGTVPECTKYMDYKRHTAAAPAQACSQRTKAVLAGPAWDDLPLSQTLVLSKLTELAVFEEGRWSVHPNILRKYRPKLTTLFGLNELSTLGMESDDAALSAITFPPWEFLTDVVAISQRSNRPPGSKRRSIDVPAIGDEVELAQVPPPADSVPLDARLLNGHSLTVVVKRLTSVNESTPSPPQRLARKTAKKFKQIENTNLTPLLAQPLRENLVSENVGLTDTTTMKTEEPKLSSVPSVGRKRATLDTFFTPPTKRPNVTEQSMATPSEVIHIESD
ncbi:hypothetical protein T265_06420 [Opisthorchis viverrini]|uniref:Chromatin assembly factor 1 subunit A n=1 Tax=Opisthorchis viverrini TaxID=6198 RepID=A0A074ZGG8_OPIVI|nr:hypothetical protein T265_06420 [Opisthorchis viverrini]KER26303.1 hypothetical protein T265_06420 [Opisthorchis viverrini]